MAILKKLRRVISRCFRIIRRRVPVLTLLLMLAAGGLVYAAVTGSLDSLQTWEDHPDRIFESSYEKNRAELKAEQALQKETVGDENGTAGPLPAGKEEAESVDDGTDGETPEVLPEEEPVLFFSDVSDASLWYYRPVYWAAEKNLTTGIRDMEFGPEEFCTRAQILTFLWRAAGEPEPVSAENRFWDVSDEAYYRNAVLWAVEQGIAQGVSENAFHPDELCNRAQCVTFLWRYHGSPDEGGLSDFEDVPEDSFYGSSVFWALKNGITNGTDLQSFSPDEACSRAQVMTFLYRSMAEHVEKSSADADLTAGGWQDPEVNGTTGSIFLKTAGIKNAEALREVRAAVWTKDDQSDLRWFIMKYRTDGEYGIAFNAEDFGRHFGTYHISLSLLTDSGDQVQLVHMEDASFEAVPQYYMYTEDAGKGYVLVHILGADAGVSSLSVEVSGKERDPENPLIITAGKTENRTWSAVIDVTPFMDEGYCNLDVYSPDTGNSHVLNTIRIPVEKVKRVIDVSQHQGSINWKKAEKSGSFEAVIIRCGYRGSEGECSADSKFRFNADACRKLEIPMGVYWFTSALTVEEALQEADYCAKLLEPYDLSLPVFLDTEWGSREGLNDLDPEVRTECVVAFLKRMEEYGYETGIYASSSWLQYNLNYDELSPWFLWAASWSGRPEIGSYDAWQYTTEETISGVSENTVDVSYWFN